MASEDRFGYEWSKYSELDPNHEGQFWNWVHPLEAKDFAGKRVLDAGCGMGRNSFWALKAGARELVAFDYNERSLTSARKTLSQFTNVRIFFKNIHTLDFKEEFDLAFSIGVIHHLENPEEALKGLYKSLLPDGKLAVWVYSKEGYEWVPKYINPIRIHITSRLPLFIMEVLSFIATVPLYIFVKLFSQKNKYYTQLSNFGFRHIWLSIVFDQLIPTVANYWTKDEVAALFIRSGINDFSIYRPANDNGWTIIATKH